jgi:catecholate siderophore receptor
MIAVPQANLAPVSATPMAFKAMNGYWIFNMMIRRPISDRLDFQANLINLTNKFYIDQPHPNHLIPGEGFNAQFGLNAHF